MPYIEPPTRKATARFGIPNARLPPDLDPSSFLIYTPGLPENPRPQETLDIQLHDIRHEMDEGPRGVYDQVHERGWAVARHESRFVREIGSLEGAERYREETCELMRSYLNCTKVYQWNSTVRKSDQKQSTIVDRQKGPEEGFLPTSIIQPPASHAHVDQDEIWAPNVVRMATKQDPTTFKRSMIINIWRPLKGPVTSSPLCMLHFPTLSPSDTAKQESQFGTGIQIHYAPSQKWCYLRHMTPDEIVVLKCYDSLQGSDGGALYAGHVAAEMDDSEGVEEGLVRPRESIEVRMVAVWE
ncbi:hypothetical protein L202_01824 [Cryptococcus amylolentus CBS 6039]|uniref:Uncharacterized protein n=1 Tax=Cryptococcus amylolentus CBS 6039 TaxID=1295533 RepID=A0A1E3I5B5_9TREE|nr:hypothetical protein L202_01824 [Cryptococcus amylolentus CBS 6039]ODN83732.1 hypothetical protein L202_01824 [Cryptococcus amylolentus CBS 6039]